MGLEKIAVSFLCFVFGSCDPRTTTRVQVSLFFCVRAAVLHTRLPAPLYGWSFLWSDALRDRTADAAGSARVRGASFCLTSSHVERRPRLNWNLLRAKMMSWGSIVFLAVGADVHTEIGTVRQASCSSTSIIRRSLKWTLK